VRSEKREARSEKREARSEKREARSEKREARSEKLIAKGGDSSGTQRKGNIRRWKPLPSSAVKTIIENTSLCVIVICKV
jgi:uncharacterized protein (DUF3084 family)